MRSDSPLLSGRSSILHRATATPLMTLRSVSREGLGRFLDGYRQLGRCLLETRIFDTARRFVIGMYTETTVRLLAVNQGADLRSVMNEFPRLLNFRGILLLVQNVG